jgi:hypothetical protein
MSEKTSPATGRGPAATRRRSAPEDAVATAVPQDASLTKPPRFHFFLIDSGWNSAAARVIRDNLDMITRFQNDDPLFILTREQSTALMRRHPHLIGKDPILLARDLQARGATGDSEYHGFHLNMGLIRNPDKAVEGLRNFLHFLAAHRHSANIEKDVQAQLHRQGLQGAIEVLRAGAESMVG